MFHYGTPAAGKIRAVLSPTGDAESILGYRGEPAMAPNPLLRLLTILFLGLLAWGSAQGFWQDAGPRDLPTAHLVGLPAEVRDTLALIRQGGPFPYAKDGAVFLNRENRLPAKPRGHYREYTVPTPGVRQRGARRIVAGRDGEFYYTQDHYRSFWRIRE
jgi:ribonuclease T1